MKNMKIYGQGMTSLKNLITKVVHCQSVSNPRIFKPSYPQLFLTALLLLFFINQKGTAQIYAEFNDGVREVNLCNCMVGDPLIPVIAQSLAMGNSQDLYYISSGQLFLFDIPSGTTSVVATLPAGLFSVSMVYGPDGLIYLSGYGYAGPLTETLVTVNPNTGAVTVVGDFLPNFIFQGDLFFNNGSLYGFAFDPAENSVLLQIPTTDPASSVIVHTFPDLVNLFAAISVFVNGVETVFARAIELAGDGDGLIEMDIISGDYEFVCVGPTAGIGDLAAPPNYVVPPCCSNDAGSFSSLDLIIACSNQTITLDHLGDEALNPGSALSFVAFGFYGLDFPEDLVLTSATSTLSFNPATMNFGTPYFVAAVAAPGPAGNPDWSSNCIDLSLYAQVAWREAPTVAASANPVICGNGCVDFPLEFTGAFPVVVTWEIDLGAQTLNGSFSSNAPNAVLSVCPPAGGSFPTGSFDLQFLTIADDNCTCD